MSYSGPVTVNGGDTLQAMAKVDGYRDSEMKSITFEVPNVYNNPTKIPYGTATVDGDLSNDWSNAVWTSLNVVPNVGTSEADVITDVPEAYYAAKWQKNKVYVAVKVRDTAHYFTDTYTRWNARDAIEVFLHTDNDGDTDYSTYNTLAQQYEFGFKMDASTLWANVGPNGVYNLSSSANVAKVAGQVNGQWLYYEIEMTPFTYFGLIETGNISSTVVSDLFANEVIGLDVDIICNNSSGTYLGKKSENNLTPKYNNWKNFGLHKLTSIPGDANGDNMVDVGDLGILAANYGGTGKTWSQGDFNDDGLVDVGDLGILAANYGTGASGTNWDTDYAKVFGASVSDTESDSSASSSICSALGLPLVSGLLLVSLVFLNGAKFKE
jgi:hypothetical protein